MSTTELPLIVEVDAQGDIHIPADALGNVEPKTRYVVTRENGIVHLNPELSSITQNRRTPEERIAAFKEWIHRKRPPVPTLPDDAFRRENMYD